MTNIAVPLERAALFLDLDGTLARIEPTPDAVKPDARRSSLLKWASEALNGRVAVLSGRTIEDVDRILNSCAPCVAGVHGLERRNASGRLQAVTPHPALEDAKEVFDLLARARSGLLVEPKTGSLALHYRGAPAAKAAVQEVAGRLAGSTGLVLQEGDMVAELRTPGADKGDALTAFMREAPFSGFSPIFIGDDLTDESGFEAAERLGGAGILVGPARKTGASVRFRDPAEVLGWIAYSLDTGVFRMETTP